MHNKFADSFAKFIGDTIPCSDSLPQALAAHSIPPFQSTAGKPIFSRALAEPLTLEPSAAGKFEEPVSHSCCCFVGTQDISTFQMVSPDWRSIRSTVDLRFVDSVAITTLSSESIWEERPSPGILTFLAIFLAQNVFQRVFRPKTEDQRV